jgi:hypothetical protein
MTIADADADADSDARKTREAAESVRQGIKELGKARQLEASCAQIRT